jgi:homoserine O-acetyltransferase
MSTLTDPESVGLVETRYFTFAHPPNRMPLDSGESLGPITLAYETYGTLNEKRSNAILIAHALSGDAHVAGYHSDDDRKPGWWEFMVGPGKPFDTSRYFVICSNVLGGCQGSTGPISIHPETGSPYNLQFPVVTIGDMVRAQKALVDHLGIETLLCVTGGSMGGMQALEWSIRYPDSVFSVIPIATAARLSVQGIAFDEVGRHAIYADAHWCRGDYSEEGDQPAEGLKVARMLAHITYLSEASMRKKFGRRLQSKERYGYDFSIDFQVESYLRYQGESFIKRFDANTYLYITKAMDYFDIQLDYGSLDAAFKTVQSRFLILSFTSDWLFPSRQSRDLVRALQRNHKHVTFCEIDSPYGHDSFLIENQEMKQLVSGFLDHACHDFSTSLDSEPEDLKPTGSPQLLRGDLHTMYNWIPRAARVLDLGCGDGELLDQLIRHRQVTGVGIEIDGESILACAGRGVPVIQADLDAGLEDFADNAFDVVILSQTVQTIRHPDRILKELVRVGRMGIVSVPNFGYWRIRTQFLLRGRMPKTAVLPHDWYNTPNIHLSTLRDVHEFCKANGIRIRNEIHLVGDRRISGWRSRRANWAAERVILVLEADGC